MRPQGLIATRTPWLSPRRLLFLVKHPAGMTDPRLRLLVGLVLALATGCGGGITPAALKAAWEGRPAAALEKDWGPATRETPDGELRILIYEEVESKSSRPLEGAVSAFRRGATPSEPDDKYRGPSIYVRSYLFWVNPQGTIVHTAVRTP